MYLISEQEYLQIVDALVNSTSPTPFSDMYAEIYQVIQMDDDFETAADGSVIAWFGAATQANAGVGAASDFIRDYTAAQIAIRTGAVPSNIKQIVQAASDAIANAVLEDITASATLVSGQLYYALPTLQEIGTNDALQTLATLSQISPVLNNPSIWSGNLLFSGLGDSSYFAANIIDDADDTYDLFVAIQAAQIAGTSVLNPTSLADLFVLFWDQGFLGGINSLAVATGMATDARNYLTEAYSESYIPGLIDLAFTNFRNGADFAEGSDLIGLDVMSNGDDFVHLAAGDDVFIGTLGKDLADGGAGEDRANYQDLSEIEGTATHFYLFDLASSANWHTGIVSTDEPSDLAAFTNASVLYNFETVQLGSKSDIAFITQISARANAAELAIDGGTSSTPTFSRIDNYVDLSIEGINVQGDVVNLDRYQVSSSDTVEIRLDNPENNIISDGTMLHGDKSVALFNFEHVIGSSASDHVAGEAFTNYLFGLEGNDILVGRGLTDFLIGDAGDDILYGGEWAGLDRDATGALPGTDALDYFDDGAEDLLYGGSGFDTYYVSAFDSIWDATIHQVDQATTPSGSPNPRFFATGDGAVFFNGLELKGGERVAQSNWDTFTPPANLGINIPAQLALFMDYENNTAYRILNGFTFATNGSRVDHYVMIVEDRNENEAISIAGVRYDPDSETLGITLSGAARAMEVAPDEISTQNTATQVGGSFLGMSVKVQAPADDTDGNDRLRGDKNDNILIASGGDDVLSGGGGNDDLYGGSGADQLKGGGGDDRLEGGAGADVLDGARGIDTADYMRSNAGVEVRLGGVNSGGHAEGDVLKGIENIAGSGAGDRLYGDENVNMLWGRGGDDYFEGGGGADIIDGGRGNDAISFAALTEGEQGVVEIDLGTGTLGGAAAGMTLISIESIAGTDHFGLFTGPSGDTLIGDAGRNDIYGLDGSDTIDGGAGDDLISGGFGADTMTGGTGSDVFLYWFYDEDGDTITDFDVTSDLIIFDLIDGFFVGPNFSSDFYNGTLTFIADAAFSGTEGELRYEHVGTDTAVGIDLNGDGASNFNLALTGTHDLTIANFRHTPPPLFANASAAIADADVANDNARTSMDFADLINVTDEATEFEVVQHAGPAFSAAPVGEDSENTMYVQGFGWGEFDFLS